MLLFSTKIQRLVEVAVVSAAAVVVVTAVGVVFAVVVLAAAVVVVAVVVKDVKNGSTKEAFILLKMGINYPSMKFLSQQAAVVAAKVDVVVVVVAVDAFIAFVVVVVVHDVGVD